MHCPFCNTQETRVIDSRLNTTINSVRRRRECLGCAIRFTTYEEVEIFYPRIIKRDGRRTHFDENKLRQGMLKALEKRPIAQDQIESSIMRIKNHLHGSGEREIHSSLLGQWLMDELRFLDLVAYVRFASVYLSFDNLDAFIKEIDQLKSNDQTTRI